MSAFGGKADMAQPVSFGGNPEPGDLWAVSIKLFAS